MVGSLLRIDSIRWHIIERPNYKFPTKKQQNIFREILSDYHLLAKKCKSNSNATKANFFARSVK